MMKLAIFLGLLLTYSVEIIRCDDSTTVKQAIGTDVVRATLKKIEDTCVFGQDFMFMRRLAWVESQDGMSGLSSNWSTTIGQGGIWQVSQHFLDTAKTSAKSYLNNIYNQLKVNITALNRTNGDLEVPLNDAVAARAFLDSNNMLIPADVTKQAQFWQTYYNPSGSYYDFLARLQTMPECKSSIDLLFILDSSGSITDEKFENVRSFVISVVSNLTLSDNRNRVGVIEYSDYVLPVSNFSTNATALIQAVTNMQYLDASTDTTDALNNASDIFSRYGRPPTEGFPWVAVLITDGAPNGYGADSNRTSLEAAQNLKSMGVTLFVVGVGEEVPSNLEATASTPTCVYYYSLDDYDSLASSFPGILTSRNCEVAALAPANSSEIVSTVDKYQSRVIKFPVNKTTGMTWKLSMNSGKANFYASLTSTNPSSANFDYKATATTSNLGQIYISPNDLAKLNASLSFEQLRQLSDYDSIRADAKDQIIFIYTAVEGVDDVNNFTLKFNGGDHLEKSNDCSTFSTSIIMLSSVLLFLTW